jgi:hypothetical protein
MKNGLFKDVIVLGILFLFFSTAITPCNNAIIIKKNTGQTSFENLNSDIITMINKINYSILFGYLEKIVSFGRRPIGSENCKKAAEYIAKEFRRLGLDSYIDKWKYLQPKCQNVIGINKGTDPTSDAVFVLTAHLDTIGNSVGANDDASGVAALLTIANITSKFRFNHTIKFVIVSGEELGGFGSFDYTKKAYRRDENIIANINLDTIGNTTFGNIIVACIPERSHWLYYYTNEINQKYADYIDLKLQMYTNIPCDSKSFIDYGYDAITFAQSNAFDYPFHGPKDTLDKIVYPYFENVTKLILALTIELAKRKIDLQVRIMAPKEGYIYLRNWPIIKLPGFNSIPFWVGVRGMTYLFGRSIVKINITTKEEIVAVSYSIDGNTHGSQIKTEPPYKWKISKPFYIFFRLRGKHKLGVHVYTSSGKTAYDEMDFFALTGIL